MSLTVDGFENMIAGSLGIEEPWYICKCTVDNATQTMHIYVSVRENAKICCPLICFHRLVFSLRILYHILFHKVMKSI